jgi:hypothetical protein
LNSIPCAYLGDGKPLAGVQVAQDISGWARGCGLVALRCLALVLLSIRRLVPTPSQSARTGAKPAPVGRATLKHGSTHWASHLYRHMSSIALMGVICKCVELNYFGAYAMKVNA